jgi:predicted dehydrogenase
MRAVVVGAGSIGLRHQRVLAALGVATTIVSRRGRPPGVPDEVPVRSDLASALLESGPDHVVVATETSDHLRVVGELADAGFSGTVVVEKPLTDRPADVSPLPFRACVVGYQLRLHPAVLAARELMAGDSVLAVHAQVGQHLADWRPGRAVGDSASARVEDGGGVLRDLSHELDLVLWLAGDWSRVAAFGGRSGALGPDVATDDRWGILLELAGGATATVHLDALDHVGQRRMTLVGERTTVAIDLIAGTVRTAGRGTAARTAHAAPEVGESARDALLADLHRAVLEGSTEGLCSIAAGVEVVRLIEAVERSAHTGAAVLRHEVAGAVR